MENSNFIVVCPGKIGTYHELSSFWHNIKASCEKNEKFENFKFLFIYFIVSFYCKLTKNAHESHM